MTGAPKDGTVEEWRRIARRDWQRIRIMLAAGDGEAAGFYLQQSLEKFFKAFLASQGQPLRRIHALQALLDVATASHRGLARFRPFCERVSGYYVLARYPDPGEAPEVERIQQDLDEARHLILALFPDEKLA